MLSRSLRSKGRKLLSSSQRRKPIRHRPERRLGTRRLRKLPLSLLAAVIFALSLSLQLAFFTWEPTQPSLPVSQLTALNKLVQQINQLLGQDERMRPCSKEKETPKQKKPVNSLDGLFPRVAVQLADHLDLNGIAVARSNLQDCNKRGYGGRRGANK